MNSAEGTISTLQLIVHRYFGEIPNLTGSIQVELDCLIQDINSNQLNPKQVMRLTLCQKYLIRYYTKDSPEVLSISLFVPIFMQYIRTLPSLSSVEGLISAIKTLVYDLQKEEYINQSQTDNLFLYLTPPINDTKYWHIKFDNLLTEIEDAVLKNLSNNSEDGKQRTKTEINNIIARFIEIAHNLS